MISRTLTALMIAPPAVLLAGIVGTMIVRAVFA